MIGPYSSDIRAGQRVIRYCGNKLFAPIDDVCRIEFESVERGNIVSDLSTSDIWPHIHKVDSGIFVATVAYFQQLGADWCNLPLTTLMISSPGEIYGGRSLDYTTDALPVELSWFDVQRPVFLSESSQFYLELALLTKSVDKVFAIYNSFRKERADFCRLSEFSHIEFEGHVSHESNVKIAVGLLEYITNHLLENNSQNLQAFLTSTEMIEMEDTFRQENVKEIAFSEALDLLQKNTGDSRYREFSLKHFGAWEEIKLTQILESHVVVREMPLIEVPFYHKQFKRNRDGNLVAENGDILLFGYRETVGSGARIVDLEVLEEKCRMFNLPKEDYAPYLASRRQPYYQRSCGFGMGWQRYTQWVLKLPFIWNTCRWPRGHTLPTP